jgi:hypothetical protein
MAVTRLAGLLAPFSLSWRYFLCCPPLPLREGTFRLMMAYTGYCLLFQQQAVATGP